ncbi:MAG: dipeptidase [Candidatus Poribacteria bacterium]
MSIHPIDYVKSHRQQFVTELKDFIRFPSVSIQPKHSRDLEMCAVWLADHLRLIGLEGVRVLPTKRHPLVYAEWQHAPGRPTVLIYGHYDVQPVEPLDKWQIPPFEPKVYGDYIYGRGSSDDKGQLFAHIKALESYLRTNGRLPVNVKCLFEGEEEIGSPNLFSFLLQYKQALSADVVLISDTHIIAPNRPAITYALRGMLSLELEVCGPKQVLHSGSFSGAIHNPLQAICEIMASLHDTNGRVAIPGFYDRVRILDKNERNYMARVGPSNEQILIDAQSESSWGESGYTLYERTTIRPALTVNSVVGNHLGPGSEGVIASRALAKISFRLVPDQTPSEIEHIFRQYIAQITPHTVRTKVFSISGSRPVVINRRHPMLRSAVIAYNKSFGAKPVFLRSGGTIPIVSFLQDILSIPTVLMGFALPDDQKHAPNERFYLPNFFNGIETIIWFLAQIGGEL